MSNKKFLVTFAFIVNLLGLAYTLLNPGLTKAQDADFSVLLGSQTTEYAYRGESKPRATNIEVAASRFHEIIVKPGMTISFNTQVGPRNKINGFKEAPVIIKGQLEDGYGGGVCQVAGTLHAAAQFAGLGIIESTQHSRTSSYIEPGLDSTVAWGQKDLEIENIYKFPIKLVVIIEHTKRKAKLTFEIYGKEKLYEVKMHTKTLKKIKPETKYIYTWELKPKRRKVEEQGTPELIIVRTRQVFWANTDYLALEEVKRIWYKTSDRIIKIGAKRDDN